MHDNVIQEVFPLHWIIAVCGSCLLPTVTYLHSFRNSITIENGFKTPVKKICFHLLFHTLSSFLQSKHQFNNAFLSTLNFQNLNWCSAGHGPTTGKFHQQISKKGYQSMKSFLQKGRKFEDSVYCICWRQCVWLWKDGLIFHANTGQNVKVFSSIVDNKVWKQFTIVHHQLHVSYVDCPVLCATTPQFPPSVRSDYIQEDLKKELQKK